MSTATGRRPTSSATHQRRAAARPEAPPAGGNGTEVDQRVYEAVSRALLSG